MRVELQNVMKEFDGSPVVNGINLSVDDGEFVALLGPSGCGKTTTLCLIAGIYKLSSGSIKFDGKIVNTVHPKDRNIGMVFQSYALYPHMTVYDNITFPLRLQKTSKDKMKKEANQLAEMLGLSAHLDRRPGKLSGGEQQRVSLARALIKRPKLLLFDEPLSNLDAKLRTTMRAEIKRVQKELGITSIYVTHDQVEAMTMADRIAVMMDGEFHAFGVPRELHDCPETTFVAQFIGTPQMNLFEITLERKQGSLFAGIGNVLLQVPSSREPVKSATNIQMGIRPQDIQIAGDNGHAAKVELVQPMGYADLVFCDFGSARIGLMTDPNLSINTGDVIHVMFNMEKAQFFDADSKKSILWRY